MRWILAVKPSARCEDDSNAWGWHGNAILSSVLFERLRLIRLDEVGHWFVTGDGDPNQPGWAGGWLWQL